MLDTIAPAPPAQGRPAMGAGRVGRRCLSLLGVAEASGFVPVAPARLRAGDDLVMGDLGGAIHVLGPVAAPLREERPVAKALRVRLDALPVDGEDEAIGVLNALMKGAAEIAGCLSNDVPRGPQAFAELLGLARLGADDGKLHDHGSQGDIWRPLPSTGQLSACTLRTFTGVAGDIWRPLPSTRQPGTRASPQPAVPGGWRARRAPRRPA